MSTHIVILGAGFGGLELSARLSSALAHDVRVTLIDKNDAFVFGFSKFDLMFGREELEDVSSYYRQIVKPGVEFRQELVVSIDPAARTVKTERDTYAADILVVALGADYDFDATPGFVEGGEDFYSIDGALRLRTLLPSFTSGNVIIGVLGEPFKCPPAPSEAAMLLDEWLISRGVRSGVEITLVMPWELPIPVSASASEAILKRFAERGITYVSGQVVASLDPAKKVAVLRDGRRLDYDLFLGVPVHRVPAAVEEAGLAVDGWIPVDRGSLATRFPDVYAIGDIINAPVPKAGMFAESAGRAVAERLIAQIRGGESAPPFDGAAACYIEFGDDTVGRVDADFLTGPSPTGPFSGASLETAQEKKAYAATRRQRWFGD